LSRPRVRRTILLLSSSEYVSDIVFSNARISKTSLNSSAQHALGSGPQAPGREITKCILVVTPLAFWACDWPILPIETLLREYSRAGGKIVKHWPVRDYKRVGDHYLSVYLSNTYCRCKILFGTPI